MKQVIITRKKKLASAWMPFWIIAGRPKAEFMAAHGLRREHAGTNLFGQPVQQFDDPAVLDVVGIRIANGQTVTLELPDEVCTVFAATITGSLSNEVQLTGGSTEAGIETFRLTMKTKGGWMVPSYPWFEQDES